MIRNIRVASGIGDNIWLLQKLINAGEKFNFLLPSSPPQRGKQIFDLLPQVAASAIYTDNMPYRFILSRNVQRYRKEWKLIREQNFYLCANEHLEAGKRIEQFLPDLPTSYHIDWQTTEREKNLGENYIRNARFLQDPEDQPKIIGVYTSAYSTQRSWGFWDEHKWLDLLDMINVTGNFVFMIIGAIWDVDLSQRLMELLMENEIRFINLIGEPLGVVVEVMKRLDYFMGFPSGLSVLNETLGKNGIMFYPPALRQLMNTWAASERIASGAYKACLFCEPKQVFNWLVKNERI